MNDWLKRCVFNPLTRTITPVWCLGWSLKRKITLVWLERSVRHVINLSLRSWAAVHHCCSPILQVRNSERVRVLQRSNGGRSLTGEKSNSREDSHTRSVRWPSPLRASVLKRANFSKRATRVLNMSYHPCITRAFYDRCLTCLGIQFSLSLRGWRLGCIAPFGCGSVVRTRPRDDGYAFPGRWERRAHVESSTASWPFEVGLVVSRWGSQRLPPVPFFPEVHEELARSWQVSFTARKKSCGPTPGGSTHYHFRTCTVHKTGLCSEVEPIRRMVFLPPGGPPEMFDQSCAFLFATRVGA